MSRNRVTDVFGRLVQSLEDVKKKKNLKSNYDKETGKFFLDLEDGDVAEISEMASYLLFDAKGRVDQEAKAELQRRGYRVIQVRAFKDELVSGWLIAGIEVEFRGVIAFDNSYIFNYIEDKELEKEMKEDK
jgi:hypothetical protein